MGAADDYLGGLGQYQSGSVPGVTIQFADGKIKNLGADMAKQEPGMGKIETVTKNIRVDFPGFGVVGLGLSYAHDQVKGGAGDAISMARTALLDYRTALAELDKNYQQADKDNDGKISTIGDDDPKGPKGPKGPGGPDLSKMTTSPQPKIPDTKIPDNKIPGPKDSDLKMTGPKDSDYKMPGPKDSDYKMTGPKDTDYKVPGQDVPDRNLQSPTIPDTTLPTTKPPSIEDQLNHNTTVPDLNAATRPTDPAKTTLSAFDPNRLNTALPTTVTTTSTPDAPTLGGNYSGSPSSSAPAASAATGRAAMNGMSGMPFMPMGGGAAGGEQDRERDKPEYVRGDENDWLDDMDIAPPVLGE